MLDKIGYRSLVARDGIEAVEIFKQYMSEIVLVLLDLSMPYLNGVEVFQKMQGIDPDVRVILCSGFTEEDAINEFSDQKLAGFLHKPFTYNDLKEKIELILGQ